MNNLQPYWNKECEENVKDIIFDMDWFINSSNNINKQNSYKKSYTWCDIKWLSSKQDNPLYFEIKNNQSYEIIRIKSILLKPTKKQKQILQSWMGSYRFAYNLTIDIMKECYYIKGTSGSYMKNRKEWIEYIRSEMYWWKEIPAHTIYGAMRNAEKDYKNIIRKYKNNIKSKLPRCKKKFQKSFFILGNCINNNGIYLRKLGKIKSIESLPNQPMDSRIIHSCKKWYLQYPYKVQTIKSENQGRVCSLDPGIRSFLTIFSNKGLGKIQHGGFGRIVRLSQHLDDILSRLSKIKNKQKKQRMKLASDRIRVKIKNLIKDLHFQSISFLIKNFDTIILPDSNFTSAISKIKRKINNKSVRMLLTYSFAKFRDRLQHKVNLFGKNLIIVNEAYTSKTHNLTGEIIKNLGGRKNIISNGIKLDRDINGALGIFLKALLTQPIIQSQCNLKRKVA